MYSLILDNQTKVWRKLHNVELQRLFQKPNIVSEIAKRRFMWAGHAWSKRGALVKWVIEEDPI